MFITQYAHYSSYIKEDGNIEPPTRKDTSETKNGEVDSKFEEKKNEIASLITNIIHEIAYEEISKRQKPQYSTIPINIPPSSSTPISEPITISMNGLNTSEILSNINNIINNVKNNKFDFNNITLNSSTNNDANINTMSNETITNKKKEPKIKQPKIKKETAVKEPKAKKEPKVKETSVKEPKVKEIKPRAPRKKKTIVNEEEVEISAT